MRNLFNFNSKLQMIKILAQSLLNKSRLSSEYQQARFLLSSRRRFRTAPSRSHRLCKSPSLGSGAEYCNEKKKKIISFIRQLKADSIFHQRFSKMSEKLVVDRKEESFVPVEYKSFKFSAMSESLS